MIECTNLNLTAILLGVVSHHVFDMGNIILYNKEQWLLYINVFFILIGRCSRMSYFKKLHEKLYHYNCRQETKKDSQKSKWLLMLSLPIAGLFSLIWFLIRVIPNPTRAAYPCMKVAAPIASTFIVYIVGFITSIFAFSKA